jgi:hypothetical protein
VLCRPKEGAAGRGDGLLAVGQILQRLPCVAQRIAASPPHQDVGPAVAHFKIERLRHLMLRRAGRANDSPRPEGGRAGLATEAAACRHWAADVGPEAVDVNLVEL